MKEADTSLQETHSNNEPIQKSPNQGLLTRIPSLLAGIKQRAQALSMRLNRRFVNPINTNDLFKGYNLSQLCYFAAMALLLMQALWAEEINYVLVGLIGLVGLTRELLRLFEFLWSYTLGKSFILVLYAGTANMSLAFAAMQINLITGVEPTPFVFTLGFTSIVLLPFWIAMASMLFFILALCISFAWLIIRLPLKLIGFKVAIHWEDKRMPFLTMLLRMCCIPVVLTSIMSMASNYFSATVEDLTENLSFDESGMVWDIEKASDPEEIMKRTNMTEEEAKEVAAGIAQALEENGQDEASREIVRLTLNGAAQNQAEDEATEETTQADGEKEVGEKEITEEEEKSNTIRNSIAFFLFHFEAYPNSMCQKEPEQRSVIIDENLVLLIKEDNSADYGYEFKVVKCEPRVS